MSGSASYTAIELPFGRLLKFWRGVRAMNQETLASKLDSSPRHISRLENGRSLPSKALVLGIARELALGERDTNHLLIAAGFNPNVTRVDFHAPQMRWLRKAMTMTLRALDPYPATLIDGASNILMVNRGWVGLFSNAIGEASLSQVSNHFDFLFSRQGAATMKNGWEDTLSVILMSLQQAALMRGSEEDQAQLDRLMNSPNVPEDWRERGASLEPMASYRIQLEVDGVSQTFFNVSQTVGAMGPNAYVSEPNLTINTLYPEDEAVDLSVLVQGDLRHPLLAY
ncbi:transcriptional regulator [Halioglobus japonicus]|uniref:XRE family transcriptional regulator n=1 Tax=Halioglobus japonicus TaxID=930805 RepID=A0AAP8SPY2_9GAMM|nr:MULTISPECIES: helix-turn-helix domain-containing protein [Halioglobus]AQA19309.1 transcriptional regulator [Halioglobus japonicus]KZX59131.1 transcriptional regulator [Halioglobus sp. HI00S01]PLW87648.1 XRE family transcriptional regulator [Halioglobus japonicus]GHD07327.1 transcriptional regulator [Halioglobus japonicus]